MNPTGNRPPDDQDDPAVQAEWRRLEAERLAEERAEAREDAQEAAHEPAVPGDRRWRVIAFAIALAAGIVTALVINPPRESTTDEESQALAVREAMQSWSESSPSETATGAGPRLKRGASTAALPAERLRIRVGLRDDRSRERLESLLAASGLRIEGDLETAVEEAAAHAGAVAAERLAVSGRPATVDALLDALAASADVLALEGEGFFVEATAEPAPETAGPETELPARVRLVIEIAEVAPEAAP